MTENQPWGNAAPTVDPASAGTPSDNGWSKTKMAIVAAVAGMVVIGGGVAVADASASSSSSTSSGPGGGPGGGGGAGLQDALYGDFTVTAADGSYTTERLQSGTVTAVSSTSITAKSADGHTTTFTVGSATKVDNGDDAITDVRTGDTVTVVGTLSGDTVTAATVTAATVTDTTLSGTGTQPSAATT